jgi:hypothetical protein
MRAGRPLHHSRLPAERSFGPTVRGQHARSAGGRLGAAGVEVEDGYRTKQTLEEIHMKPMGRRSLLTAATALGIGAGLSTHAIATAENVNETSVKSWDMTREI